MLKMHGGHLRPDNVRLAHRHCNRRDFQWRKRINAMLAGRMSLVEIAEKLNADGWWATELRTFYVAMTRARDGFVLLTGPELSPLVIRAREYFDEWDWR